MSSHKHHEHLTTIKDAISKTESLNEDEKSQSVKIVEEWFLEDRASGTLKQELLKISLYFEELFSELGIK
jgi:hypothetical protein